MKKTGLLNQALSNAIAGMGHNQMLCIADAGLPIPLEVERIDLALMQGIPSFLDTVRATLLELKVDSAIIAEEMQERSPQLHEALLQILDGIVIKYISHEQFKTRTHDALAIVRTGEFTPYANVILVAGVVF
jgi:D-ribose pyranase